MVILWDYQSAVEKECFHDQSPRKNVAGPEDDREYLNQLLRENGRRNVFKTILHERMLPDPRIEANAHPTELTG